MSAPRIIVDGCTADVAAEVTRRCLLENPLSVGWSLRVYRAGAPARVAEYPIDRHDGKYAWFKIDGAVRDQRPGEYIGEVFAGCNRVGRIIMKIPKQHLVSAKTAPLVENMCGDSDECLTPRPAPSECECVAPECAPEPSPCEVSPSPCA